MVSVPRVRRTPDTGSRRSSPPPTTAMLGLGQETTECRRPQRGGQKRSRTRGSHVPSSAPRHSSAATSPLASASVGPPAARFAALALGHVGSTRNPKYSAWSFFLLGPGNTFLETCLHRACHTVLTGAPRGSCLVRPGPRGLLEDTDDVAEHTPDLRHTLWLSCKRSSPTPYPCCASPPLLLCARTRPSRDSVLDIRAEEAGLVVRSGGDHT